MIKTPMCDKLHAVKAQSQPIGEFLEWLQAEKDIVLCRYTETDFCLPVRQGIESLLAEFFEIDLEQAEREKQLLLANLRDMEKKCPK